MPRKALIRTDQFPYHVTIRCNNKEWFEVPLSEVWEICISSIRKAQIKHPVQIQAFVLMSNHYHLMLWTPNADLDKFMFEFNRLISRDIRKITGRINRIFGDRYKWSLIQSESYYMAVERYIYQNPLRAKICKRCENYPYSSLRFTDKKYSTSLGITNDHIDKKYINWINRQVDYEQVLKLRAAISRPIFKIPTSRSNHF